MSSKFYNFYRSNIVFQVKCREDPEKIFTIFSGSKVVLILGKSMSSNFHYFPCDFGSLRKSREKLFFTNFHTFLRLTELRISIKSVPSNFQNSPRSEVVEISGI